MKSQIKQGLLPVFVLVFGTLVTLVVHHEIQQAETSRIYAEFDRQAAERASVLGKGFQKNIAVLQATRGFITSAPNVNRKAFHAFITDMLMRNMGEGTTGITPYDGIQAIEWLPRVTSAERAHYERQARQDGLAGFQIFQNDAAGELVIAPKRPVYYPVYYVEAFKGVDMELGFDLASTARGRQLLAQVRDSGEAVVTPPVQFMFDGVAQYSLMVYQPVYGRTLPADTPAERRQGFAGVVIGIFPIADIVRDALKGLSNRDMRITLFDAAHGLRYPVFVLPGGSDMLRAEVPGKPGSGRHQYLYAMKLGKRTWHVMFTPAPGYLASHRTWLSQGIDIGGLLFTALLSAFIWQILGRTREVERQVEDRTADLSVANQQLAQEVSQRVRVEEELRAHRDQLEMIVQQRTRDLAASNDSLHQEVTERLKAEEAAEAERAFLKSVMEGLSDPVTVTDTTDHTVLTNQAARRFAADYLPASPITPDTSVFQYRMLEEVQAYALIQEYARKNGERRIVEKTITPLWRDNGAAQGVIEVMRDITDVLQYEEKLAYLTHHDTLTGLPNRALLHDRIDQAILHAERAGGNVAVLFLDLDGFKNVNDTLGHEAGDRLLCTVAARLQDLVRKSDTVARLGGDEFVMVLEQAHADTAALIARKILDAVQQPITIERHELRIGVSIGICLYPQDGLNQQTLLRNADTAMYQAKEQGRHNYQFYREQMNASAVYRMRLQHALHKAIESRGLALYYQPKVNLGSGAIVGVEALLRWHHPELGNISPADFIPVAEESGLILALGEWVLFEACRQQRKWQEQGLPPLSMAVNVSARQFRGQNLAGLVSEAMRETGMDPHYLELELTESILMTGDSYDQAQVLTTLNRLRALGVQLSIDDFGTGYSSLSYLKRFPVDALKIDRSFVRDIPHDKDDTAIATAIIAMGHSLELKVVAEGVEQPEQAAFLRSLGCDESQGFFYSPAVPANQLAALLVDKQSADSMSC